MASSAETVALGAGDASFTSLSTGCNSSLPSALMAPEISALLAPLAFASSSKR